MENRGEQEAESILEFLRQIQRARCMRFDEYEMMIGLEKDGSDVHNGYRGGYQIKLRIPSIFG